MTFDPVATAGLETREVLSGSRDGVPTKIAVASRHYAATTADVWDALTNTRAHPALVPSDRGRPDAGWSLSTLPATPAAWSRSATRSAGSRSRGRWAGWCPGSR